MYLDKYINFHNILIFISLEMSQMSLDLSQTRNIYHVWGLNVKVLLERVEKNSEPISFGGLFQKLLRRNQVQFLPFFFFGFLLQVPSKQMIREEELSVFIFLIIFFGFLGAVDRKNLRFSFSSSCQASVEMI